MNNNPSFPVILIRTTVIAAAANAGAVIGIVGGLVIAGNLYKKFAPTTPPKSDD